jgi:hypothetical protein
MNNMIERYSFIWYSDDEPPSSFAGAIHGDGYVYTIDSYDKSKKKGYLHSERKDNSNCSFSILSLPICLIDYLGKE